MTDPLAAAAATVTAARGAVGFLGFVRDHVRPADIIAAMFSARFLPSRGG